MRRFGLVLLAAFAATPVVGADRPDPARAGLDPVRVDALVGAIASRFGPIELDPALRAARSKFARDSLSPSRLVDDPVLWTGRRAEGRVLEFGAPSGLPYRVGVRTDGPSDRSGV